MITATPFALLSISKFSGSPLLKNLLAGDRTCPDIVESRIGMEMREAICNILLDTICVEKVNASILLHGTSQQNFMTLASSPQLADAQSHRTELLDVLSEVKTKVQDRLGSVDFPLPQFILIGKQSVCGPLFSNRMPT